jgi:hypothetical protein
MSRKKKSDRKRIERSNVEPRPEARAASESPAAESLSDRETQIACYIDGEMTPEEAAAFARAMAGDAKLRTEAEQWRAAFEAAREWMTADVPGDVPGLERASEIVVPQIEGPAVVVRTIGASKRTLPSGRGTALDALPHGRASALIVRRPALWQVAAAAAIFVIGFVLGQIANKPAAQPSPSSVAQPSPPPQAAPTPSRKEDHPSGGPRIAGAPKPRYTKDEHGRVVVETTLEGSGARALWVVDAGFQLSQSR